MRRAVNVWEFCAARSVFKSLVLVSVLLASACDGDADPDGDGGNGGGGPGVGEPSTELTCSGIIDCLGACAETDTACSDACVDAGSESGVEAAYGVAVCITESTCEDDDCLIAECEAELQACADDSWTPPPTGNEPPPEPPPGVVDEGLLGTWHGFEESYTFREDGTVSRDIHINSSICSTDALEHGQFGAEGSTLTIYWLEGEISTCGGTEPYQPYAEVFSYEIKDGGQVLVLSGGNCTANCVSGFDKQ